MRHLHRLVLYLTLPASPLLGQGTLETELAPGDFAGPIAVEDVPDLEKAPVLRFCDRSALALGYLDGAGEVVYRIPPSGRPDTASIRVATAEGVSSAGLRSAAARYLGTCRFDAARTKAGRVPALVRQRLRFNSRRLQRTYVPPPQPLPAHPDSTDPDLWDVFAASLDEAPRPAMCRVPNLPAGRLRLAFVVDTAGRVVRETVQVLEADPAKLAARAPALASSCRFVPGRVEGRAVRVRLVQTYLVQ